VDYPSLSRIHRGEGYLATGANRVRCHLPRNLHQAMPSTITIILRIENDSNPSVHMTIDYLIGKKLQRVKSIASPSDKKTTRIGYDLYHQPIR
jgi:hypothetical protein